MPSYVHEYRCRDMFVYESTRMQVHEIFHRNIYLQEIKSYRCVKSTSYWQNTVDMFLNLYKSQEPYLQTGTGHSFSRYLNSYTHSVFFIDVGNSFQILAPW